VKWGLSLSLYFTPSAHWTRLRPPSSLEKVLTGDSDAVLCVRCAYNAPLLP